MWMPDRAELHGQGEREGSETGGLQGASLGL